MTVCIWQLTAVCLSPQEKSGARSEELGAVVAASPQFYKKQEIFLPFKAFDL